MVPEEKMPVRVTYASSRVAALPAAPVMPTITPLSFLSRHAACNAARSMVRMRVRMPTACRYEASASPIEV